MFLSLQRRPSCCCQGAWLGPKYEKPTAAVAPDFKEVTDSKEGDGWKKAQPDDTPLRGKWWELYGDARLNEREEQVDPSNQTLRVAEANFRQARTAIRFNRVALAGTMQLLDAGIGLFEHDLGKCAGPLFIAVLQFFVVYLLHRSVRITP